MQHVGLLINLASTTQFVFEIPDANTTNTTQASNSSVSSTTESFLSPPSVTPIHTLGLAHGLKLFSGAMLLFSLASVALKHYGMAGGILAYSIGLFAFWKVHRMATFAFMVVAFLDIGSVFAYAYIQELYNSNILLGLHFVIVLLKFYAFYNAFSLWNLLSKEDEFKLPEPLNPDVALDK